MDRHIIKTDDTYAFASKKGYKYMSPREQMQVLMKMVYEQESTGLTPEQVAELQSENARLQAWVNDLQSGMYVNCVYCGHRYGPEDQVPTSMADALKEHIEQCPQHPMSALKLENERLKAELAEKDAKHV